MPRQTFSQLGEQRRTRVVVGIDPVERDERDQARRRAVAVDDAHRGLYVVECGERSVDFAEFDAVATYLGLVVGAAAELETVIGGPAHQVAGAVHPLAGIAKWIGDEAFRRQSVHSVVAACQVCACDVEFAGRPGWDGEEPLVEDDGRDAADRSADRDARRVRRRRVFDDRIRDRRHDRRLRRPVGVEDRRGLRPPTDGFGIRMLAADHQHLEIRHGVGIHGGQQRGREECVGDACGPHQIGQFATGDGIRSDDAHRRCAGERHEEFEDRGVEAGRRHVHRAAVGGEAELRHLLCGKVG